MFKVNSKQIKTTSVDVLVGRFKNYVTPWGRWVYTFFVILRDGKLMGWGVLD